RTLGSARLLGALLLGGPGSVPAEFRVAVRLRASPPATHEPAYHKTFLHRWGPDQLRQSKQDAAGILARQGGQRLLTSPSPLAATALPPATEVTGFDGIDENATFAYPPDGAVAVCPYHIVPAVLPAVPRNNESSDES